MAVVKTKPKPKRKKRTPLTAKELDQRRFARKVRAIFVNMGFTPIPTEGKHALFGNKKGEIDSTFLYENILLVVEDTTSSKPFDHAKNKKLLADQLTVGKDDFINWLRDEFPEHKAALDAYAPQRFRLIYLYVSQKEMDLDDDSLTLLTPMKIVTTKALNYFDKLAKTIRRSARTDLWRFLNLGSDDIGAVDASSGQRTIKTTIISPSDSTGYDNGVRLVSFMISADTLLRNSYVLRKDNWGYSIDLYQRLIEANRIKKIREYVATGGAFLNNIIIGLPANVTFQTSDMTPISLDKIENYASYRMTIPDEFNSLCIVDGQHRVFAHYEGIDDNEAKVAVIRQKVHLLATGLVFPASMNEVDRLRLQSQIFLDINANTKPVPPDVLLSIQSLRAPYDDVAIARRVLEGLNKKTAFRGMFQLSQMEDAPIKIASIVKFALRYLVDIDASSGLFAEWVKEDPKRGALSTKDDPELLAQYVQFAVIALDRYFNALRSEHESEWGSPESKVTSTTVINAMIIALRRAIPTTGLQTFDEYQGLVRAWPVDFSKSTFIYTSSQYNRFSLEVLRDLFGLEEKNGGWSKPA